ncbi:MAG: TIGR00730 family Rossman fold protein, partial [Candidatus Omnitrophica bacterium]|nr:TIGR00730 family Rossman fold protein [Candidatus Omnitrophota bacterium]
MKKKSIKYDFTSEETWRIFRIMAEFVEGFEVLSKLGPAV